MDSTHDQVDHYRVTTTGVLPAYAHLDAGGLFDWASDLFNAWEWFVHGSNLYADLSPGERVFLVKHFNEKMTSEAAIAWGKANGYRVATHAEAIDFAAAHPDLQLAFPIAALGSFTLYGGGRCLAVLAEGNGGRGLGHCWFERGWLPEFRFLFVKI